MPRSTATARARLPNGGPVHGQPGGGPIQGFHPNGNHTNAYGHGGMIHGPGTGVSDSIPAQNGSTGQPVKVSNGEYIIPADVVATKGREFFDNIVRKYHTPAAMQRH